MCNCDIEITDRQTDRQTDKKNSSSIVCQYGCTIRKVLNGRFLSADEIYVQDVGKELSNTICARYYKGLEGDNSNAVLVVYE